MQKNTKIIKIKKGLNIPIEGEPKQEISDAQKTSTVALIGPDYIGMKPTMAVNAGDRVKKGSLLFTDKKNPGVKYTSPVSGSVLEINRGEKRAFQSIVINVDGDESETFKNYSSEQITKLERDKVEENLNNAGMWSSFRTRPFSKTPALGSTPNSIFVTAMDTNPLAARANLIIKERPDLFVAGLKVVSRLTNGKVHLCHAPNVEIPGSDLAFVNSVAFKGPHPAGLPGTHIHFIDPVGKKKTVWYVNYQDVMAIGQFFLTGKPDFERVIAIAGPSVKNPRLIRTIVGANINELLAGNVDNGNTRLISGSVLSGRTAVGALAYLGKYHLQITALSEGRKRDFFGWIMPSFSKYSLKRVLGSCFFPGKKLPLNTNLNGGKRSIMPIGSYEKVMPLDIFPTFLLKSLAVADLESAEELGCLELDEEDLALCSFVCPGKGEYGQMLRDNLTTIEKEG